MLKTKRGKALAAVLGVAVAVLFADRILGLVPMGPESAEASAVDDTASLSDEFGDQMRATAALSSIPPAPRTLADRLEELRDSAAFDPMDVPDALSPSKAWLGKDESVGSTPVRTGPVDLSTLRARQFARRHKLTATAVGTGGGRAIVNGQCVTVGKRIGGMTLVSVDRNSATFQVDGVRVRLMLARD